MKPPENLVFTEPPVERIEEVGNFYFRSIVLDEGQVVKQHIHDFAHATLVGNGRARGWAEGLWIGDKGPGEAFLIFQGEEHLFQALLPETRLICIHETISSNSVKEKGI